MLVHCKTPKGVLHLNQYKIYGKHTKMPPIDIPFQLYNQCKDGLAEGTYREGHLQKMFGGIFPVIAFTYTELRWLPDVTLDKIGPLMVSGYDAAWSHKKKVDQIKVSIREKAPCL